MLTEYVIILSLNQGYPAGSTQAMYVPTVGSVWPQNMYSDFHILFNDKLRIFGGGGLSEKCLLNV
jgi:hypothetical protein